MFLILFRHSSFTAVSMVSFGFGPFRCLLRCLLPGETQIWLGDLRLALCWGCFVLIDLPCYMRPPASM
jgi:hypothetical protein